ncbi:Importin 9 [Perkinsus chesapeaki]|uniref:Importin 9 n=1 Tax=Perkinsus chesapeaki TaxID=330153 RepID=A0A7J6MGN5_PERCH|nr:Importin 9 [Perkinsus chesapeaki]
MSCDSGPTLLALLEGLTSPHSDIRRSAEAALSEREIQPGFQSTLCRLAADPAQAVPMRQLALTIVKRNLRHHWEDITAEEQDGIRGLLGENLFEPNSTVRKLVHACAAQCAAQTSLKGWENVLDTVVRAMQDPSAQPDRRAICFDLLQVFQDEAGPEVAGHLLQLEASLRTLAMDVSIDLVARWKALDLFGSSAAIVAEQASTKAQRSQLAAGVLSGWLPVVEQMARSGDVLAVLAAVRIVSRLLQRLGSTMKPLLEAVLDPVCEFIQKGQAQYVNLVVNSEEGGIDEEEDGGPTTLLVQFCELLSLVVSKSKLRPIIKGKTAAVLELLAPYCQITESQIAEWTDDPATFLANEDDDFAALTVRLSAEGMVAEMLEAFSNEAFKAIIEVATSLVRDGTAAGSTNPYAWKKTEVGLIMTGWACEAINHHGEQKKPIAQVDNIVKVAAVIVGKEDAPPFLRLRGLALLAKISDYMKACFAADCFSVLQHSLQAMQPSNHICLRLVATRSFCQYLRICAPQRPEECNQLLLSGGGFQSIGSLMNWSGEGLADESMHLCIEALTSITRFSPKSIVAVSEDFLGLTMSLWDRAAMDPLVHLQVLDLLSCACGVDKSLLDKVSATVTPKIRQCLAAPDEHESHTVGSSIELLSILLKRSSVPYPQDMWSCVEPLLNLCLHTTDAPLMQNACDTILYIVRRAPMEQLEQSKTMVLSTIERLLNADELDDSAAMFAGPLITAVVERMGSCLGPQFMQAMLQRLLAARAQHLVQSLLVVFARLVHANPVGVVDSMASFTIPLDGKAATGLEALMAMWCVTAPKVAARDSRTILLTALIKLIDSRAPALLAVRTRTPLPVRLIEVLTAGLEYEVKRDRQKSHVRGANLFGDMIDTSEDLDGSDDEELSEEDAYNDILGQLQDFGEEDSDSDDEEEEDEINDPLLEGVVLKVTMLDAFRRWEAESHPWYAECPAEVKERLGKAVQKAVQQLKQAGQSRDPHRYIPYKQRDFETAEAQDIPLC